MARLTFRAPAQLSRFIAPKGSVALDGVSLTVNEAKDDRFDVLIIPHTLEVPTFGALRAGDTVNLEVDLMARYAARLIERRAPWPCPCALVMTAAAAQGDRISPAQVVGGGAEDMSGGANHPPDLNGVFPRSGHVV